MPDRVDRRAMTALAAGHLIADSCQGAVPALLPFFVADRGYSIAAAGALVLCATVASSFIQPLFGHYSDAHSRPWLMPAGIALAGGGLALTGVVHSYALTLTAMTVSGVGIAAFHPEASRFANYVSGERRATGMSFFQVGGNAGFAVGPILATPLVLGLGLGGTAFLAVLPALMALLLWRELERLASFRPPPAPSDGPAASPPGAWGPFARLIGAVGFRSLAYFGLMTSIPLYFHAHLHASRAQGSAALATMLAGGAVGTLIGGRLADRFSRRTVVTVSLLLIGPLVGAFLTCGPVLGTVVLFAVGAATVASFSVTVVMGQEYLPGRIGVASGFTIGVGIGLGGLGAPLIGAIADRHGLRTALEVVALLPLPGALLAATLPGARPAALRARVRPAAQPSD